MDRRSFLGTCGALACGAAAAGCLDLARPPPPLADEAGPIVLRDPRTNAKRPLTLDDLQGPPSSRVAEWAFLPALVVTATVDALRAASASGMNAAEHAVRSPRDPSAALLVFNGKCTHLGCTVGFHAGAGDDVDGDGQADGAVRCPYHAGRFDPYALGENEPGTPPPRPLEVYESDILPSWQDPETGQAHTDVLHVLHRHPQDEAGDASGRSVHGVASDRFELREAGWSGR